MTYNYDANGNMLGWNNDRNGQKRRIVWDEENRVESVTDGSTTSFFYDADGTRAMKRGRYGEVVYVNENYAVRNGEIHTKHVFAGNTRLATKLRLMRVQKGNVKTSSVTGYTTTVTAETTTATKTTGKDKQKSAGVPLTTSAATSSVQETVHSTAPLTAVRSKAKEKATPKNPPLPWWERVGVRGQTHPSPVIPRRASKTPCREARERRKVSIAASTFSAMK